MNEVMATRHQQIQESRELTRLRLQEVEHEREVLEQQIESVRKEEIQRRVRDVEVRS